MDRVEQMLGVAALAVVDRLGAGVPLRAGGEAEVGALVHLQAWPGRSVGDLSRVVGLSQPATVRLVDRLVGRGLLGREEGRDRRTRALVLTDAGSRAADQVLRARAEALGPMLVDLTAAERETLERLLGRVVAGLAQDRVRAVRVCRLCDREACGSGPGCPLEHTMEPGDQQPTRSTRSTPDP